MAKIGPTSTEPSPPANVTPGGDKRYVAAMTFRDSRGQTHFRGREVYLQEGDNVEELIKHGYLEDANAATKPGEDPNRPQDPNKPQDPNRPQDPNEPKPSEPSSY